MTDYCFFQAEDDIRGPLVTGVQTCALPISLLENRHLRAGAQVPVLQQRERLLPQFDPDLVDLLTRKSRALGIDVRLRSEERRVGKECRSRWSSDHGVTY